MNPISETLTAAALFESLFDPDVWADPYPMYATLRERGAVVPLEEHLWLACSHEAVSSILRHPGCSSDERRATLRNAAPAGYHEAFDNVMIFMDPPDHTRLRSLMVRSFTPRHIKSLTPRASAIAEELLQATAPADSVDVIGDLARPLAVRMICELLGVPFEDHGLFGDWGDKLARLLDPAVLRTPEQDVLAGEAAASFRSYFLALIADRRQNLGEDLLSQMILAESDGARLSLDELVASSLLLLVAGFETTINLIGNGVAALVQHRPQYEQLRNDAELTRSAVDEMLRWDPPAQMVIRVATDPIQLCDQNIAPGDTIIGLLAAANRDPLVFNAPEVFDISRAINPHIAFGAGIHHCIGAALARAEAQAAFAVLAKHHPELTFAEPPHLRPTFTLRGYDELRIAH